MPNGRCRMHGGKHPGGMATKAFKTGRYSKYLPQRLLERYTEASTDAELLALREEVALVDARLADLLSRVDTGESGALWGALNKAWADVEVARDTDDGLGLTLALALVSQYIKRGQADYAAWQSIGHVIEQRRKLVESERKRLVEMQQMVTSEQAMLIVAVLADTVRKHVHDPDALRAISADITRLVIGRDGAPHRGTG
jgi:predicted transcriptional regulator